MPSWKKVIVSGSDASLNSVNIANGANITGSVAISGSTGTIFSANVDTLIFSGSILTSGSLITTGSVFTFGNSYLTGSLNVSGSTIQIGNNTLTGNTSLTGSVNISGSTTIFGTTVFRNSSTTITGSLLISGSTTQIGSNTLQGNTILTGSISMSGSIGMVGSITASSDINIGGILKLNPAIDPGTFNETSSYLFTSASNTSTGFDLYYRQKDNLVKFKWLEGGISTGLLYGGVITYSGSYIYVTSGSGIINSLNASTSSEVGPIFTYISWNSYTSSAQYLTSSQNTYLYVDDSGVIHQQDTYFTEAQYQQSIPLGRVTHANYTTITGVGSNVQTTYDSDQQQNEFIRSFGPMKVNGLTVTGQTGSLRINVGAGTAFNLGGFYPQSPNFPSQYTSTVAVTASITRAYRTGSGTYLDNNGGAFYTTIDPTKYDDGSGTLQNTGTGNFTIQRVFYNPVSKRTVVYYGQSRYTTLLNALQYLNTDPFTEGEFTSKSLVFVAYLVLKGNTTDLNDTDNRIIESGLFRSTAGGSSSGGAVPINLNDLGDVNITNPTQHQALIYDSGIWVNGNPVSSSYAITASYVIGGGGGSGNGFPYSGSASITGSLDILATNAYANDYADNYTALGTAANLQGSLTMTGSVELASSYTMSADYVNVGEVLKLNNTNPLPTAGVGLLAVSASNLYYSNGITWTQIN